MRRIVSYGPAFVVLLSAVVVTFAVPSVMRRIAAERTRATVMLAQQRIDSEDVLERLNRAVRDVSTAVEPSVVHIDVEIEDEGQRSLRASSGSGWIYDDLGHVITNAHVVAGATSIRVQYSDASSTRAELIGADLPSDIAVLRVEPGPHLVPMRRATQGRVQKGDRVFAYGSPFNFKFSMSEGIVSGLGRSARTATGFVSPANFIQTDAAVNPGNSGGPLVDIRGRLVGMNVAIATAQDARGTSEGQSAGISFAIPLTLIESRVSQLISGEPVAGGYLGVMFGEDAEGRVRISRVVPDSPAAKAGLKVGDAVLGAEGETIHEPDHLRGIISAARPGAGVRLHVLRDASELDVDITLGAMPAEIVDRQYVQALQEELGLSLRDTRTGPRIQFVIPDSPAAEAGLVRGERILRVGPSPVTSAADAARRIIAAGTLLGRPSELLVLGTDETDESAARSVVIRGQ